MSNYAPNLSVEISSAVLMMMMMMMTYITTITD